MFVHVVLFTWRPGTSPEHVKSAAAALQRLFETTSGLADYAMGPDLGFTSGRFGAEIGIDSEKADFGVVMRFDSAESWHAYNSDQNHRAVVRQSVGKMLSRRISVQFEV